jgi:hypothetical protein
MRYRDFRLVEAPGDEEAPSKMAGLDTQPIDSSEIEKLQSDIANRVGQVADPAVLHRIQALLRKSNIGNIAKFAFKKDSDSAKFIDRLSEIILALDIPIVDKVNFLREFGRKNMIKAEELFDNSGQSKSMDSWFEGSETARTVFKIMINDPGLVGKAAGETGPGELAIACFHRDIVAGTDPKAGYDLKYGNELVEVKTKAQGEDGGGGGRWTAMNDYPMVTFAQSGNSPLDPKKLPESIAVFAGPRVKLPTIAQVLNDPQYLLNPDAPLDENTQRKIFQQLLAIAYPNADAGVISKAANAYPNHTRADVAPVAFESYKGKQKFTSMMLMKANNDNITTLHFTDLTKAFDNFTIGQIYLNGQQRGMSMQATLK